MLKTRGLTIPRTLEEVVSPDNTCLLIYDMQAGITPQIANADEIVSRVRLILESARRVGMRTFFTRHMSLPKNLMGAFQIRTALAWQRTDSPDKIKPMFCVTVQHFRSFPSCSREPARRFSTRSACQPFRVRRWKWLCEIAEYAVSLLPALLLRSESIPLAGTEQTSGFCQF